MQPNDGRARAQFPLASGRLAAPMGAGGEEDGQEPTPGRAARGSSEDGDHAAMEVMAQRTVVLLDVVTRTSTAVAPLTLTPATLSARPVPMDVVYRIVSLVSASTGFGADLLSGGHAGVPSGSGKLQFFQQWCVRILESGSLARTSTAVNPNATARAILIEHQKQRAPLALNGFLQELAQAAAQHRQPAPSGRSPAATSRHLETGALLPDAAAKAVEVENNRTFSGRPLNWGRLHADAASIASGVRAARRLDGLTAAGARSEPELIPKMVPDVNGSAYLEGGASSVQWETARRVKTGVQVSRAVRSDRLLLSRT